MSEATGYEVQLAETEAGVPTAAVEPVATTSFDPTSSPAHFWYWRVRAVDGEEFGPWSAISSLTVGWSSVTISGGNLATGLQTDDTTPTMHWTALPGAASYELQIIESGNDVTTAPSKIISAASYTTEAPLANNTTYIWRVRGIDADNQSTAWANASFTVNWGSTGPADGIRFVEELQALPDLAGNYTLGGNIDLSDISSWTPIGTQGAPFTGTFDGAGYTITGLTINNPSGDYQGLFGYVSGSSAEIIDVGLQAVNVTGQNNVGALVGYIENGLVNRSHAMGSVSGDEVVGGLVGSIGDGARLTDSFAGTNNAGNRNVGGLVGWVYGNTSEVSGSYATGTVSNTTGNNTGGLVGRLIEGTVSDSYATGRVSGGINNIGGLVGFINPIGTNSNAAVSNSYATGAVSRQNSLGSIGGLVGQISNNNNVTVSNSFYDRTGTGQGDDTGKGDPKTPEEMRDPVTFTNWDFDVDDGIWTIDRSRTINNGYPYLQAIPPQ